MTLLRIRMAVCHSSHYKSNAMQEMWMLTFLRDSNLRTYVHHICWACADVKVTTVKTLTSLVVK